ncbi:hypothetical protein SLEP1_g12754 [Rubroshorea leprosula]|uniref:Uncharacterized protein n=1 Tax=Rubroshorea leprosula TaxID=152421 RepID=A0AAV5IMZ7_9ROSI|nr:hypothetical protein SLEP1_g12754 [Rubroshorea leprosula]
MILQYIFGRQPLYYSQNQVHHESFNPEWRNLSKLIPKYKRVNSQP